MENKPDKKPKTIRDTNEEARSLARQLIRTARFGALAVNSSDTGFPLVTRISIAPDISGTPITLISQLSQHTKAIQQNNKVSILLGEPGKGDPLAHPRISLACTAQQINKQDQNYLSIRQRFLRRHKKSELYIDFADFSFFKLEAQSASLNGGFGKAYELEKTDFISSNPFLAKLAKTENDIVDKINNNHSSTITNYIKKIKTKQETGWTIASLDFEGVDLIKKEDILRLEFNQPVKSLDKLKDALMTLGQKS